MSEVQISKCRPNLGNGSLKTRKRSDMFMTDVEVMWSIADFMLLGSIQMIAEAKICCNEQVQHRYSLRSDLKRDCSSPNAC